MQHPQFMHDLGFPGFSRLPVAAFRPQLAYRPPKVKADPTQSLQGRGGKGPL